MTTVGSSVELVCEAADGPRNDPLTWAQQHMLQLMDEMGPATEGLNIRFHVELRSGLTRADALRGVRELVVTSDALRSTYVPPPEGPAQRVARTVTLTVPVIDAGDDPAAAADAAAAATARLASTPFDITAEWPIRAALVAAGDQARYLAFAVSHLVVDDTGAYVVKRRLQPLLARRLAPAPTLATAVEPLDEARWEQSPAGVKHGLRAAAQHEGTFRVMPQTMVPRPTGDLAALPRPRYRYLEFDSVALAGAVPALVARHKVSGAAVLHAAVCAMVGRTHGLDRAYLQLTVGNRIARNESSVGMYTEDVPVFVELGDAGLAELIPRSGSAVIQAARFGRYPPHDVLARRRAVEMERGLSLDLSCWLNYRRARRVDALGGDRPSAGTLRHALRQTRWRWTDGMDNSTSSYFIFADDTGATLRLTLLCDSALVPPDEAVRWLRAVEWLVCAAVNGDAGPAEAAEQAGLAAQPRDGTWWLVDHSWVHLPTAADLVRRVVGAAAAGVFRVPAAGGDELCAFLAGPRPPTDLERLHAECVAALPGVRTAMAPHRYVWCAGAPGGADLDAWSRLPVLMAGTGRPRPDQSR